jgi:uncharacterized protein YrzB (UPF0473 family)
MKSEEQSLLVLIAEGNEKAFRVLFKNKDSNPAYFENLLA